MPLNGNTYVAPTWRNGQPPALDAAELQAISDTLAAAQSKNTDQDSLIAALQTAVGGKAQIEVGSYVGTGTYGADNPNSITCSFAPKLIWIYGYGYSNGIQLQNTFNGYSGVNCRYVIDMGIISTSFSSGQGFFNPYAGNIGDTGYGKKSSDGKTVYWYINKYGNFSDTLYPRGQLNEAGFRYYRIAIA